MNGKVSEEILWRHLRDLPYFRALVRGVGQVPDVEPMTSRGPRQAHLEGATESRLARRSFVCAVPPAPDGGNVRVRADPSTGGYVDPHGIATDRRRKSR